MSAVFFVTSKHDRSQYHLADATGRPRCGARFRHATQLVTKYEPRSLCSNCWQYSYRALVLSGEAWFPNCFIFEAEGRWHIEGNSINHPICLPLISLAPERRHYHRLVPLSERESIAKRACEACLQAGRETRRRRSGAARMVRHG